MPGEYYIDRGTGKMELHFDKAEYLALPQDTRQNIKRYFNFSRGKSAWISKGQANSFMPQNIVKELGFTKAGEVGEKAKIEAPPGMQTGHQAGALGVPTKVVTQKSTGKAVTASMDAQIQLNKAREEAKEEVKEIKEEVKEIKEDLGTISQEDARELSAGLDLRMEKLEEQIDQGEATLEAMQADLDPAVAKLTGLIPSTKEGKGEITHITKGQYQKVWGRAPKPNILTKDGKSVRWEYALDEIAQQLHLEQKAQAAGMAPDEYLKDLIEEAKGTKSLMRATEIEIESDKQTLKALDKLKENIKARTGKVTTAKTLEKMAKAPKVKPLAKVKPATKAKTILASVANELVQKIQDQRTPRAIIIDNSLLAAEVVPLSQAEKWAKHPSRIDIAGVDTPGHGGIVANAGYADKGSKRLSRKHHKGFKKIKYT